MIYKALVLKNNKLELVSNIDLRDGSYIYGIWGFLEALVLPEFTCLPEEAVDWCQKNGKLELINTNTKNLYTS